MTAPAIVPQDRRPSELMDAERLICPRCGKPIRRITIGEGHGFATCDNAIHRGEKCGQHIFFLSYGDGVVTVMPITRAEHDVLQARPTTRRHCLMLLGVLRSRDESRIPSGRCSSCSKDRKKYDLFNGVCRWCITGDAAPGDPDPYRASDGL